MQKALQGQNEAQVQQLRDSMDTLQQTAHQQQQESQRYIDTLQQKLQQLELAHQVEVKQHMIDDRETQLQANEEVTVEFQRNLLQHEQTNKQLQETVGQPRSDLQQAVEEKQAGERQLQELQLQLQTINQAGTQTIIPQLAAAQPQDTITRPRQELQHTQQVEEISGGREGQLQKPTQQLQQMKQTALHPQKALMQQKTIRDMKWQKESKAPEKMSRGSATSDSNMAYFNGWGYTEVYSYDSNTHKWHQLPDTPHIWFTLVVVQHILTMVGGYLRSKVTNSLLSLMGEGVTMKWLPHYPPMPTARRYTAAVCSGHSLIVAGGQSDGCNRLATVEVLDTVTKQWSTACSLPHPFSSATISICGEWLYLMAADLTRSVLTCSVHELFLCQIQPLAGKLQTAPAKHTTKWWKVANAPYSDSSCATLCGQLVAVGGRDGDRNMAAIFSHNATTDTWEAIGKMPTARCSVLVAIVNGKLMAVGGWVREFESLWDRITGDGKWTETDVLEILC